VHFSNLGKHSNADTIGGVHPTVGPIIASVLSGGLAGGCVSTFFNRVFHWRSLRIKFYPTLSHMFSAYRIRTEDPKGRYWVTTIGKPPLPEDDNFIRHRTAFVSDLIQFTELREVRRLRKAILANMNPEQLPDGVTLTTDLTQDVEALTECLKTVQGRLNLS
jgi:hypothetical protein